MDGSHRLVPSGHSTSKSSASIASTANSVGLHDTLRYGPKTIAEDVRTIGSGLKQRLENWEETQDALKLTIQRNTYGMHAPMRLLMERKLVAQNPHMPAFTQVNGASNVHLDILMGRDELIEPHDVFAFGGLPAGPNRVEGDIHREMESKLKI